MDELLNVSKADSTKTTDSFLMKAVFISLLGLGLSLVSMSVQGQNNYAKDIGEPSEVHAVEERSLENVLEHQEEAGRLVSISRYTIPELRTKVSLDLKATTVEEALQRIGTEADLKLSYGSETVVVGKEVTLQLEDVEAYRALQQVVEGTGLTLMLSRSGHVVIAEQSEVVPEDFPYTPPVRLQGSSEKLASLETIPVPLQTGIISGTVTDSTTGDPLPGVNVSLVGTQRGAATGAQGQYRITGLEPGTYTVRASFVGYADKIVEDVEVEDDQTTTVDFVLREEAAGLDEVVVVGYGTERRTDVTGAVSQISADDFERVPATDALQSMQGRSPGLRIISNSGEPGAGASVRIRGPQSISGTNEPIFVVDGSITASIDHINSQDIESVSILKDASAAAIYGSRAANGVVLITTKRGANNTSPSIQFHTYGGMQHRSNLRLNLLDSDEFLEVYTEAYTNTGIDPPWDEDDLARYEGVDSDWQSAILRPGYLVNSDLSVSGGSEQSNYFVSAGHEQNRGMVMGMDYNKFNVRLNTDHQIREWISFGNSLNVFSAKQNAGAGQYNYALQKVPLTRIYEDDGSWGEIRNTQLEHMHASPLWMAENVRERVDRGLMGNIYLTLSFLEGLELTTRGNLEWSNNYRTNFTQGVDPGLGWEGSTINQIGKDNRETLHWTTDFLLDYERSFGPSHRINSLLGYSLEEQTFERLQADGTGTPSDQIRYLSAADPTSLRSENTFSDWSFKSMFARLGYTFKDRYIFNATVRRDGTSRLHEDHRYGIFPSVSAAWRIAEEAFMDDLNWMNELKLRASWGTVGNVLSVSTYGTKTSLTNWNYVFNQQQVPGYTLASAVNTDLQWESTEKKNFGLDAEMLDHSVFMSADFFIDDTYDLLFRQPIPSSTGLVGNPFNNAGQIRNTGIELELGYRQFSDDWRYSFSLNLTHFENDVIDLEGLDLRTSGIEEGHPLRSFYGYKSNGLIRTEADLNDHPHYPGKEIGDIWLLDINGTDADGNLTGEPDGVVNAADRTFLGDNYADLVYGAMGTVGYKNLTLQVQLQGVHGVLKDIRGGTNLGVLHYFTQWAKNHDRLILDRFHPENNPDGQYPRVTVDDAGNNLMFSDFWISDASYLRVSNVNLNYDFPDSINRMIAMGSLGAYVSVQNLYTFTSFYGPEVDSNADVLTGVPQPRTWTMGLKLSF